MTARHAAERHAQVVVDGNFRRLMTDFAGTALTDPTLRGATPPNPTRSWSFLSETPDGDLVRFHVRSSNDDEHLELATTWKQFADGAWKVVKAEKVES